MKAVVFDTPVSFYAPAHLVDRARQKAADEGRSLSEVMRSALRREVNEAA